MIHTVTIDPTGARTVIQEYDRFSLAMGRVMREVRTRLDGRGGSVYLSSPEGELIYRVNPPEEQEAPKRSNEPLIRDLSDFGLSHFPARLAIAPFEADPLRLVSYVPERWNRDQEGELISILYRASTVRNAPLLTVYND